MKTEENQKTRFTALIATGIIAFFFLGSTTLLYFDNSDLKEENNKITKQVETLSSVKEQLQAELKAIDYELSKYKGKNEELDHLLNAAYKDLKEKKKRINKLLKQNASLPKLKNEAESLRKLRDNHLNKIAEMEFKIASLTDENSHLKSDNERLKHELEELNNNFMVLERKVELASVLKVDNVFATSERKSKSGKYSKVSNSKKTDRLVINFELSENRVADKEEKNIYIRIIDPSGNVLPAAVSEKKGSFTNSDGNIELPYSVSTVVDYNNDKIKSSVIYNTAGLDLKDGLYTLEFYCEGYFCGASKYKLK